MVPSDKEGVGRGVAGDLMFGSSGKMIRRQNSDVHYENQGPWYNEGVGRGCGW